jgi:hypothetical protein
MPEAASGRKKRILRHATLGCGWFRKRGLSEIEPRLDRKRGVVVVVVDVVVVVALAVADGDYSGHGHDHGHDVFRFS